MYNHYAMPIPDALPLGRTILALARTLEQRVRHLEGADGLTVTDLSVLSAIARGHDLPSLIARRLQLDPARVTRATDRLVSLDCILRENDPEDRRLCRLRITPTGEERLIRGRGEIVEALEELLYGLSPEELEGLNTGLEGVQRVLEHRSSPDAASRAS